MQSVRVSSQTLSLQQGSIFTARWRLFSKNANPIDLTGYTAQLQIRDNLGELLLDVDTESGLTIDVDAKTVSLYVGGLPDQVPTTANLAFERANYELRLYTSTGDPVTIAKGMAVSTRAVIREDA